MDRRAFLALSAACIGALGGAIFPSAHAAILSEASEPFSWDGLIERMRAAAATAYTRPEQSLPAPLADLDYDRYRAIRYRPEHAVWRNAGGNFELQAFHPGWLFDYPVQLLEVVDGRATPILFSAADFEYRPPLDPSAFDSLPLPGIGGFRLHYPLNRPDYRDELVTFLGASYFRALGRGNIYGLSARGLAIDTAAGQPEEFPRFTRFYVERPADGEREIRVWAELESERVAGAYAFIVRPGAETVIDVDARIFVRGDIGRLGIAPLTSMYLFGENDRVGFDDYRPEVHDSDGLLILRPSGERLWRPLNNPGRLGLSFFAETSPTGFGLEQRDRAFDNYLDLEAHYERRPSLWIEPIGEWGKGTILLAEVPSDKEIHDNIVAFWAPEGGAKAGSEHTYRYRMIWGREAAPATDLAMVVQTRTGHGGTAATEPDPENRKFAVEFAGGMLAGLGTEATLEPKASAHNGEIHHLVVQKMNESGHWRVVFDVRRQNSNAPVELGLVLLSNGKPLTETWVYQWNGVA